MDEELIAKTANHFLHEGRCFGSSSGASWQQYGSEESTSGLWSGPCVGACADFSTSVPGSFSVIVSEFGVGPTFVAIELCPGTARRVWGKDWKDREQAGSPPRLYMTEPYVLGGVHSPITVSRRWGWGKAPGGTDNRAVSAACQPIPSCSPSMIRSSPIDVSPTPASVRDNWANALLSVHRHCPLVHTMATKRQPRDCELSTAPHGPKSDRFLRHRRAWWVPARYAFLCPQTSTP